MELSDSEEDSELEKDNDSRNFEINQANEIGESSTMPKDAVVNKLADPFEGMIFETLDAAKEYYNKYGNENGFPTRINSTQKRKWKDSGTSYAQFSCGRQGTHKKKKSPIPHEGSENPAKPIIRRNFNTIKCGCKAQMRLIRDDDRWRVSVFNNTHNHKFVSPAKRPRMKGNRVLPECAKALAVEFEKQNLPVGKVASVLNGHSLGFDERDCYNHLNATRNKHYKFPQGGDATATLNYFKKKSLEDTQFFYNIQPDNEGRAVNFFWVDGRSRAQYQHFDDVVVFDTTYKKNIYKMPFGPFTGVNHHLQSIQFGCGLLLDETEESFVWLFETWLAAMGGRHPVSIITDQDKAMTAAVAKVFPKSHHRFCFWHIESKFPDRLSHVYHKKSNFKETIRRCFWWPFRVGDFETRWAKMLDDYDLHDHDRLKLMYGMREMWIPVYNYDTFFAGMTTTGRSEGMNSVFKDYFSLTTSLRHFITKFEQCLETIARRESDEDYITEHTDRVMEEGSPLILMHAAKVYTRNIYDKFKTELMKAQSELKIFSESPDFEHNVYIIRSRKIGDHVEWHVRLNLTSLEGHCECKKFEFMGIPCRHLLKVFLRHDIDEIPQNFLLRRWMKGSNRYRTTDGNSIVSTTKNSNLLKVMHGSQLANQLVAQSLEADECFTLLVDTFTSLSEKFADLKKKREKELITNTAPNKMSEEYAAEISQILLLNPNIVQPKGRPTKEESKRKKRGIELSQEQGGKKRENIVDVVKMEEPRLIKNREQGKKRLKEHKIKMQRTWTGMIKLRQSQLQSNQTCQYVQGTNVPRIQYKMQSSGVNVMRSCKFQLLREFNSLLFFIVHFAFLFFLFFSFLFFSFLAKIMSYFFAKESH